jgi:hypothetical protein
LKKYTKATTEAENLTKPEVSKDYAFLTLTTEETRLLILEHGSLYNRENIKVSVTHDRDSGNPSKLHFSSTLVVNNLPQKKSYFAIVRNIKKVFNKDNIVGVSFKHIPSIRRIDKPDGFTYNVSTPRSTPHDQHKSAYIL